jgi:RimJ/RimL family protein N-acetyltransferase
MVLAASPMATDRLRLEPLRVEDADEMVDVLADPRMYGFTGGGPPTLPSLRERYRRMVVGRSPDGTEWWLNWIVRVPGDDAVAVGVVQATVAADGVTAEVAWEVGVPWQGRGFAGEAAAAMVDWLLGAGVGAVTACIHPGHAASAAVAVRAGLAPTDELVDGERVWRRTSG